MNGRNTISPLLSFSLAFLPLGLYFLCAWIYSTNIPSWDDYDFLEDIIRIEHSDRPEDLFYQIFDQHNEHRPAFNRIVFILTLKAFGEINFKFLAILGNLGILGLFLLCHRIQPQEKRSLLYLFPVALFLFTLQNWHNMTWTMASISNHFVILFAGISFYLLTRNTQKHFLGAFLLSTIAVFTQGSGLLVFIVGLLILTAHKRTRESLMWLFGILVVFILYFHNYEFSGGGPLQTLSHPIRLLLYFFAFLGSALSFNQFYFSAALGIGTFSYFLYLSVNRYYLRNPTVFCLIAFLVLTALSASLSRSMIGPEQALAYRYKIISSILIALMYISALDIFFREKDPRFSLSAIFIPAITGIYIFGAVDGISKLEFQKELLRSRLTYWVINNHGLFFHDQMAANRILTEAVQGGFYRLPANLIHVPEEYHSRQVSNSKACQSSVQKSFSADFNGFAIRPQNRPPLFRLEGTLRSPKNVPTGSPPLHVVLKSGAEHLLFSAQHQKYSNMSPSFRRGFVNLGFVALIPLKHLKNASYQIGICYKNHVRYYSQSLPNEGSLVTTNGI